MGERDVIASGKSNNAAGTANGLNSLDLSRDHNVFSIAKEPVALGFAGVTATGFGAMGRMTLDSILYDEYSLQPLMHKNDLLSPHPKTFEPMPARAMEESPFFKSHFESSASTKAARQASAAYVESKSTLDEVNAAKRTALQEVKALRSQFGSHTTESIFGAFNNNNITLGQNVLRMDETALATARSTFHLGESEIGMIRSAQKALQTEASMAGAGARAMETYSKSIGILNQPGGSAIVRNIGESMGYGAAAFGIGYGLDRAAVSLADNYYGQNSKLGRVMESNALGLGLSTFGAIVAPDLRSKIVLGVGGWAIGKLYNLVTDA
jgi:hypothetical protein